MSSPLHTLQKTCLVLILLLIGLGFGQSLAQDEAPSIPRYVDNRLRDLGDDEAAEAAAPVKLTMSLRDAAHQALDNHPTLRAAWHEGLAQGADAQSLKGQFDFTLTGSVNIPVATETMVYSKELAQASLGKKFGSGRRLYLEYHLERDPDGLFVSGNGSTSLYRHRTGVRAVQPLARDRGGNVNLAGYRAETLEFEAAAADYRRYAHEVVFAVEQAYWHHFAAQRIVTVYQEALSGAERLQALSRIQYEAGELSRLELMVAEAGVASRREDVILARIQVEKSRDNLLTLIAGTTSSRWLSADLDLLTRPDTLTTEMEDLPAMEEILLQRQDYTAVQKMLEAADQRVLEVRNASANRIDLTLEAGYASMGSSPGSEYLDPVNGQPISGPYVFAGFDVAFALPGTRSNADNRRAASTREAVHWRREAATREIVLEIRQARLDLESSLERVRVTRTARAAVEQQLRGEREKFAMGHTTNQSALLSENELRSARIREIQAVADLQVAHAQLRLALGTTMDHFDLSLE